MKTTLLISCLLGLLALPGWAQPRQHISLNEQWVVKPVATAHVNPRPVEPKRPEQLLQINVSYDAVVGSDLAALGPAEPWRTALALAAAVVETRAARHAQAPDPESGRTWEIAANFMAGPDLRGERVIVVARDVSRTIELQESLRKSETMSAMGAMSFCLLGSQTSWKRVRATL